MSTMEADLLYLKAPFERAKSVREKGSAEKCNPWGITGSTQHVAVCRGAEREGSAMVLVRAQRALRDLTESGLELVAVRARQRDGER